MPVWTYVNQSEDLRPEVGMEKDQELRSVRSGTSYWESQERNPGREGAWRVRMATLAEKTGWVQPTLKAMTSDKLAFFGGYLGFSQVLTIGDICTHRVPKMCYILLYQIHYLSSLTFLLLFVFFIIIFFLFCFLSCEMPTQPGVRFNNDVLTRWSINSQSGPCGLFHICIYWTSYFPSSRLVA